jgi:hypothetical protein
MPLFEVAILAVDEDEKESLVSAPKAILATSAEKAKLKAIRALSEKEAGDLDSLRVMVRPFS